LVQAGRGWQKELTGTFLKMGYTQSSVDHSVFFRRRDSEHSIVAVATDDMAVTGNSVATVNNFKAELKSYYDITDLGEIRWFLGFEIRRDRAARTISINQKAYIESMATKFGVDNGKNIYIPMLPGEVLSKDQSPFTPTPYAEMKNVPSMPASLEEALDCLEDDHSFLLKGDVFTKDVIETWLDYKRTKEVDAIRLRPHPYEFALYYDI